MNNKEMIQEIIRRLNEKGYQNNPTEFVPFSEDEGFGAGLMYLPRQNLKAILDCDISGCRDCMGAYQLWGRAGALRFEPYIVKDSGNPTLVIRHNRYLHMFRGYYFQVSETVDGIGDAGHNSYNTDFIARRSGSEMLTRGLIGYMLWWASLIDAGFRYNNFVGLFNDNREVLERFLKESSDYWGRDYRYTWEDVAEYVKFSDGAIDNRREIYHLIRDGKDGETVCAHFAIGEKTVEVELPETYINE